jgi:hypothetical protein
MSLLRLAQGRLDFALPAIRRALDEAQDPLDRCRLLPASIEIMLEGEDVKAALAAADELAGIAAELDSTYLKALAAHASGAVLLERTRPVDEAARNVRDPKAPHAKRVPPDQSLNTLGDGAGLGSNSSGARGVEKRRSPTSIVRLTSSPYRGPELARGRSSCLLPPANQPGATASCSPARRRPPGVNNIFAKLSFHPRGSNGIRL